MAESARAERPKTQPLLEICGLHAGYSGREVISGLSLCVRAGEVCALLHFEEGKRVEGRYITAYGDIHVATDTRFVRLSVQPHGGKLLLNYAVYAGGDKTSDAQLEIQWRR